MSTINPSPTSADYTPTWTTFETLSPESSDTTWYYELTSSTLSVDCGESTMAVTFINETILDYIHLCGAYKGRVLRASASSASANDATSPKIGLMTIFVMALMLFS